MITGISFVGIIVSDTEEARSLYADTLGLESWEHGEDGFYPS
jgi:catechol 2,3-dioxygenase-like lactoylglutathione lyase family enzyme